MEKKFTKKRSSHVLPVVTSENAELLRKMRRDWQVWCKDTAPKSDKLLLGAQLSSAPYPSLNLIPSR